MNHPTNHGPIQAIDNQWSFTNKAQAPEWEPCLSVGVDHGQAFIGVSHYGIGSLDIHLSRVQIASLMDWLAARIERLDP